MLMKMVKLVTPLLNDNRRLTMYYYISHSKIKGKLLINNFKYHSYFDYPKFFSNKYNSNLSLPFNLN